MPDDPDELVAVWWPYDQWQASAIRDALESQGISCHFAGEARLGSSAIIFGAMPTRQLYVRRRDADRARAFIDAHDWPSYTPRGGSR